MSSYEINTELLTAWVALCDKLGEMRSGGASEEEIAVMEELIKAALAVLVNTSSVRGVEAQTIEDPV